MAVKLDAAAVERLHKLSDQTALVEERLKEAEILCGQVVYPAVNELRYLGRNLARILGDVINGAVDNDVFERHLIDAELCCIRASNDITDAVYTFLSLEVDSLRKAYGASLLNAHFSDYTDVEEVFQTTQRLMSEARGSRRSERQELYDQITNTHIPIIIDFYKRLFVNKQLLDENYREITRAQTQIRFAFFIGVIGGFASILSFFGVTFQSIQEWFSNVISAIQNIFNPPTNPNGS